MAGLNIPGVTDQYNTKDIVEGLMKVERAPLTREQKQLEQLKAQQDAWRGLNTKLTSLRDKTKTLYSFENPFNNKLTTSSEENAITAEATRSADIQSFKIDVEQIATSDRFLTKELSEDYEIPAGMYTYKVGEKQINYNFKGGSIKDFSNGINKRGNDIIKSAVIGASKGNVSLLIEAIPTGKENKLIFEGAAKDLAFETDMIGKLKSQATELGGVQEDILPIKNSEIDGESPFLPKLSLSKTSLEEKTVTVEPRGAYHIDLPKKVLKEDDQHILLTIKSTPTEDITEEINKSFITPDIPDSGFAEFKGIVVNNNNSDLDADFPPTPTEPLEPLKTENVLYAVMDDGNEKEIPTPELLNGELQEIDIDLNLYKGIKSIAVKNMNTGITLEVSSLTITNPNQDLGYGPLNPISVADDAIIKYEGITMTRPSNKIDDIIPEITLNLHEPTEKTATLSVKPDVESSKDAIIQFVGQYNQAVAELNVLSQNKPEIVNELEYLTDEEKETMKENLGIFLSDFTLTSMKSNMQSIVTSGYSFSDDATVTMLSQIGIATNASGFSGGYSQSKLRGYLEIDEKKLDNALENNLDDIKSLFGYDSDGDLIVDSGIAYQLDKQLSAYTQTGGILSTKTSNLDNKIKQSEQKIAKLEVQMEEKEAQLKYKYGQMEGALNSLESQQNSINNFANQGSKQ